MNKYKIEWKGKAAVRTGNTCQEAMDKMCNAKVFGGNTIFFAPTIKEYDADTRGVNWARYKDKGIDNDYFINVTKI